MALEIEHKYLVTNDSYKQLAHAHINIKQGYLNRDPQRTVRIRIYGNKGFITVKGVTIDDSRAEYEYQIPLDDAKNMLSMCLGTVIDKTRWLVTFDSHLWEIDEYHNCDAPTVAEIELEESTHDYALPSFVGQEVTGNPTYYNSNIK